MDTRSPSWSRSSKSGARKPSGRGAPAKTFSAATGCESSPPVAASTTAPRARAPSSTSATAMRGFTPRRLESQLPALPVELAAEAEDVLAARQLEAGAAIELTRGNEVAEGHELEELVAGLARRR